MFTFWLEIFLTTDAQIKGPIYGLPDEMKNIPAHKEQCLDSTLDCQIQFGVEDRWRREELPGR